MGLTVERNPGEARASTETTGNLVDPSIIEFHPGWLVGTEVAGLDILPESLILEVASGLNRVDRPFALLRELQKLDGADEDGSCRRALVVLVTAEPEYNGAAAEENRGEQERAPETDVLLDEHHGNLASERTDVDEHVEVQEDTGESDVRVRDHALSCLRVNDHTRLGLLVLFGNQRRDVRLESTSSETENNDTKNEWSNGLSAIKNRWEGRNDQQNVTDNGECNGNKDGVETSEIFIGNNGTNDGSSVCPERVDW